MINKKISQSMKNPNGLYIKITEEQLNEFFSKGYARLLKERCLNSYSMFDFKQGILEANHLAVKDEHRHTVDLMLFALGKIEDLQKTITDLEEIVKELENEQTLKVENLQEKE